MPAAVYPVVFFLAHTGARRGEAAALVWEDVDLDQEIVRLTSWKTNKGMTRRSVPLTPRLAALLKTLPRHRPRVFLDARGRPWAPSEISRVWRIGVERAGIADAQLHDLRRAFASQLVRNGADLMAIAKLLGHSDLTMLQSVYAQVCPDHARDAINKLLYP